MSILRAITTPRADRRSSELHEALSARRRQNTYSGTIVTYDTALRHWAVAASVNFIADLIANLPVGTFRGEGADRKRLPTADHVEKPDPDVSGIAWRRQVIVSALMRGNTWGLILDHHPETLRPSVVQILHPDEVTVARKGKLGRPITRWNGQELAPYEVWHLTAYESPGLPVGLSPITYLAQTIGLGLTAQEFGARWFGDGAHPSGMLVYDGPLTKEQAGVAKTRFLDALDGTREPVTIGDGWSYEQISVGANESQFLETLQANAAMIATMFGLRPEDIGVKSGDSMTYANVEMRNIGRLVYPINQWIVRLEDRLGELVPRGQYVKANVDSLLRVDLKSRYTAHALGLRSGFLSQNEVRALEDLAPIDDGDEYVWPPNATKTVSESTSVSATLDPAAEVVDELELPEDDDEGSTMSPSE
jgi:HK97 family phage portal protein